MKADYSCKIVMPPKPKALRRRKWSVKGTIYRVRNFSKDPTGKIIEGDIFFDQFVPDSKFKV